MLNKIKGISLSNLVAIILTSNLIGFLFYLFLIVENGGVVYGYGYVFYPYHISVVVILVGLLKMLEYLNKTYYFKLSITKLIIFNSVSFLVGATGINFFVYFSIAFLMSSLS